MVYSQPPVPRTLISAISRVMVVNGLQEEDTEANDSTSNIHRTLIHDASNLNSQKMKSGYVELSNILRERDDCMPMNKLVSECLFLDHVTKNNRNPSLNSKWANASKKPTYIDIGKHPVPTKCYR